MIQWIKSKSKEAIEKLKQTLYKYKLAQKSGNKKTDKTSSRKRKSNISKLSTSNGKSYFIEARSWADDMYTQAVISRNRYKLAFLVAMSLAILLTIAINGLIPIQRMIPLLVNHYQDGRVSVQPYVQSDSPSHSAQVQSELVRYVVNRETYDATFYNTQYALVHLLSSKSVAKEYTREQATNNNLAPINTLGNHSFRTVHIDSVVFLDNATKTKGKIKQTHHNLSQINFTRTEHQKESSLEKTKAFTALISWEYRGTPSNPNDLWRNWDGFTITRYSVSQRNLSDKRGGTL